MPRKKRPVEMLEPVESLAELGKRKRGRQKIPVYLVAPVWGGAGSFGGTSMSVVLGPKAADSTNRGTATTPGSIKRLMNKLKRQDGEGVWKAGHLLNQDMGGSGTETENLTPLTGKANARHSGFENRIKNACIAMSSYHERMSQATHWFGIRYTVTVSDKAKGDKAHACAASGITVDAKLVKQLKGSDTIVDLEGGDPTFNFTRIWDQAVDNAL